MNTIYQLYYNNATLAKCSKAATLIDTSYVCTPFFESQWMNVLPIPSSGYMAVLSNKFTEKTGLKIENIINKQLIADVYTPYAHQPARNLWMQGDGAHKHLREITSVVFRDARLDIKMIALPTWNIYCNYFIMKVEHWHTFRAEMLGPVIESCLKNADLVFQTCHYGGGKNVSKEQLLKATGYPYYTYAPFLCERLIGTWLAHKKLKIKSWQSIA
jgi:hypothetical protein